MGWDQTGSGGAKLSFPQELGIGAQRGERNGERDSWIVRLISAAPYIDRIRLPVCLPGSPVETVAHPHRSGCWLSDPLTFHFGRRGTIFFSAVFWLLSVIGAACTQTWQQPFACLLGIGMGSKASPAPICAAGNCPPTIRGGLVMSWQMWTAFAAAHTLLSTDMGQRQCHPACLGTRRRSGMRHLASELETMREARCRAGTGRRAADRATSTWIRMSGREEGSRAMNRPPSATAHKFVQARRNKDPNARQPPAGGASQRSGESSRSRV